jgi:hypothetical protein
LRKTIFFTAGLLLFLGWNVFARPGWDVGGSDNSPPQEASEPLSPEDDDYIRRLGAAEPEPPAEPEPIIAAEPEPAGEEPPAPGLAADTPASPKHPFVFSEGVAASWLTRIIKQTGRSNFVFGDFLPGLYFSMKMANFNLLTPMIRLAAYYPLESTFNKIPQPAKTPLHYAADLFAAPNFELDMIKYARFNLAPGLHLFFLNSERWNYLNVGVAGLAGVELPLTRGWTVLINGMVSLDNGNLGGNRNMEPFDIVYQYQVDIGIRYSKKAPNEFSYIRPRV